MFIKFIKKEMVLTISFVVALVSSFFVRPDMQYIGYIDFRTLSILFMLMLTMAGLQKLGIFKQAGEFLVYKARDTREMIAILVALSFFSAMVITNDVALITFVPFTIIALGIAGRTDMLILTVVLETIAANLGSMLLPIGNPQNLYLYSKAGMSLAQFLGCMLPYSIFAFILLAAVIVGPRAKRLVHSEERELAVLRHGHHLASVAVRLDGVPRGCVRRLLYLAHVFGQLVCLLLHSPRTFRMRGTRRGSISCSPPLRL